MLPNSSTPRKSVGFWVCLIVSVALFIGGFIVPPMGVIDGSVLKAVGMLLGFGALAQAPILLESLSRAKFTKGDMTIELEKHKKKNQDADLS